MCPSGSRMCQWETSFASALTASDTSSFPEAAASATISRESSLNGWPLTATLKDL